jgi:hypothetical protein
VGRHRHRCVSSTADGIGPPTTKTPPARKRGALVWKLRLLRGQPDQSSGACKPQHDRRRQPDARNPDRGFRPASRGSTSTHLVDAELTVALAPCPPSTTRTSAARYSVHQQSPNRPHQLRHATQSRHLTGPRSSNPVAKVEPTPTPLPQSGRQKHAPNPSPQHAGLPSTRRRAHQSRACTASRMLTASRSHTGVGIRRVGAADPASAATPRQGEPLNTRWRQRSTPGGGHGAGG